ncbi:hypothetical protein D9M71_435330 [compost metagenome]
MLLQVGQEAQQIDATDRHGIGRMLPTRQRGATNLRKQLLQHAEDFLHALVGSLAAASSRPRTGLSGATRATDALLPATRRRRVQVRQHASSNQQLVGLGVDLIQFGEDVFLEQLEDDQLDLDLHAQAAAGVEKGLAEHPRPHGVGLVFYLLADKGVEADGEVIQGDRVAAHYLGDHGIQSHGFLEFVVLHQGQVVEGHRIQLRRLAYLVLIEGSE